MKDSAIFNVSFQFGTILLRVSVTYQKQICMYNYPLNSSLFGIKIEQQNLLETSKTACRIHIALCTVSSMLAHIPKILHHMHDAHFLWVQSIISIIYHPWLYWTFALDNDFLLVDDFCEGLAPILLITFLSKDKVPSLEKPYADFISYGIVIKLSPIESIKFKRSLLLGI